MDILWADAQHQITLSWSLNSCTYFWYALVFSMAIYMTEKIVSSEEKGKKKKTKKEKKKGLGTTQIGHWVLPEVKIGNWIEYLYTVESDGFHWQINIMMALISIFHNKNLMPRDGFTEQNQTFGTNSELPRALHTPHSHYLFALPRIRH